MIIRFDDDDVYAPHYVDRMLVFVQERGGGFREAFRLSQRPYGRKASDLLLTPQMLYCA